MRVIDVGRTVLSLAYSPDGRYLATGGGGGHVSLWDLADGGERPLAAAAAASRAALGLAFAPDGRHLAWLAQADDGPRDVQRPAPVEDLGPRFRVRVWAVQANRPGHADRADGPLLRAAAGAAPVRYRPDGRMLAVWAGELWEFALGEWRGKAPTHLRAAHLAVRADNAEVAVGTPDGVELRRSPDFARIGRFDLPHDPIAVDLAPDGRVAAVTGRGRLLVSDPARQAAVVDDDREMAFRAAAFTPDGRRLVAAGLDRLVLVLDADTGAVCGRFDWRVGGGEAVAVSPDGTTAAVGGFAGQVAVFDLD